VKVRLLAWSAAVVVLASGVTGAAEAGRLVTGKQVADGTLLGLDLRDNALTGRDVADGSLSPRLYDGLAVGPPGPRGVAGPAGGPGLHGLPGVHGVQIGRSPNVVVSAGDTATLRPDCPYETAAVAGGVEVDAFVSDARMTVSAPEDDMSGWVVYLRNGASAPTSVRAYVVCIAKR
jgi:hypothetical protein